MNDRLLKRMILETIQETLDEAEDDKYTKMRLKPGEKNKDDSDEKREKNKKMSKYATKFRRGELSSEEKDEYIKLLSDKD
jgi:hypothetical protein